MDIIAIKRADGGISVMYLQPGAVEDLEISKWKSAHPKEYVSHRFMAEGSVPKDRHFRDAWTDTTPEPVIDIDIEKARDITKERLRKERAPLLADLDIAATRAKEEGADIKKIIEEKKRLRDITSHVDGVNDLEKLKRISVNDSPKIKVKRKK